MGRAARGGGTGGDPPGTSSATSLPFHPDRSQSAFYTWRQGWDSTTFLLKRIIYQDII